MRGDSGAPSVLRSAQELSSAHAHLVSVTCAPRQNLTCEPPSVTRGAVIPSDPRHIEDSLAHALRAELLRIV